MTRTSMSVVSRGGTALLMVLLTSTLRAQSAAELLERGIYAEDTQGNLESAIRIYTEITNLADTARPVAAEALFRLAMCQRKAGKETEATATFQRLASTYPEQDALILRIPPSSRDELPLGPPPWTDDEVLVMRSRDLFRIFIWTDAGP